MKRVSAISGGVIAAFFLAFAGCQQAPPPKHQPPPNYTPNASTASAVGPSVVTTFTPTNRLDPALLQPPTEPYTLGPGDRVEIQLIGEPASKTIGTVGPDGKLYYDLLPGLDVWGLTLSQTKSLMEKHYSQFVREAPKISLVLRDVESRRVWILGRVQAPGIYPMNSPMTLLEAVSLAGGTMSLASYRDQDAAGVGEELADLKRSFVIREGKFIPVNFERLMHGDASQNIYLQPDDFIYFPSAVARDVYVLGAVTQPRLVPYHEGMTVAGAVAGAYGTLKGAYLSHVAVVRGALSQPQLTIVDYRHVIRGDARDVALQAGDIVYVPLSPYRYIEHYIEVILNTFVSSTAINAGTSVVGLPPTSGTPGIFIPVGSGVQIIPPAAPPPIH